MLLQPSVVPPVRKAIKHISSRIDEEIGFFISADALLIASRENSTSKVNARLMLSVVIIDSCSAAGVAPQCFRIGSTTGLMATFYLLLTPVELPDFY